MSLPPFVADADLRLDALPTLSRPRLRLAVAVLAALALELGVFALVWFEREIPPPVELTEIPVEMVEAPPTPEPTPEPTPPPTPEAQHEQEYLKPAYDAPREGKSDHDDENVAEKEKPAAEPPPPPAPSPSPEATEPAAQAPAPELPKAEEAEAPPPVKAEPPPVPPAPAPTQLTVADVLARALAVPQIDVGGAAMKAPVGGGKSRATYFSILFGMTKAHERIPAAARTYGTPLVGAIALTIDGNGRLLTRYVASRSGSPELDEAEMQAIAEASRTFPPPPGRKTIEAIYTYSWPR